MLDNVKLINRSAYLMGGLAVFLLLFSLVDYGVRNWFLIERITITGDINHTSEKQFSYIAKNRLKGNLFTLDIDSLQEEFKQIPWVKEVTVSRDFPDAITIWLSEYDAIARLNDEALITQDGKVFDGADDRIILPTFDVQLRNIPEAISDYRAILPILSKHKIQIKKLTINGVGITKIEFSTRDSSTRDSSNKLNVVICGANFAADIATLDKYWNKLYALNPGLNYVNMCYKNAMAINAIARVLPTSSSVIGIIKSREEK